MTNQRKLTIRIWNNGDCYFIDLHNGGDSYEVKRFTRRDYGDRLIENVTYHVNRIMSVTMAETYLNESDLDF